MLPELFKSEDRVKIIRYVAERKKVTVQTTAQGTSVSKPVVSRYLNWLIEKGFCQRSGREIAWVQSPVGSAIKRFLNIVLIDAHLHSTAWAVGVGIYGSFARGTNTIESDIDLWVLVAECSSDTEFQIADLQYSLSHILGYEVHTLLLTREKLEDLSHNDAPFYEEFIRDHLVIRGEGI